MNKKENKASRLSLRSWVITLSIIGLLITVIIMIVLSNTIIRDKFTELETTYTAINVKRAIDALNDDIYYLTTVCTDWSSWDETYSFVENPTDYFKDTYLVDEMLIQYSMNAVILANSSGEIVYANAYNLDDLTKIPNPLGNYLSPGNILFTHHSLDSTISGIVLLEDGPMLVVSQPILTSTGEGPINGTLIMGRYLDASMINQIEGKTRQSTSVLSIDAPGLPENFWEETGASADEITVAPLNTEIVAGYAVVRDIFGAPAFIMKIETTRDIFREGALSTNYLLAMTIIVICCMMLMFTLVIDRRVLRPVALINEFVRDIGTDKEVSKPGIAISGKDELSRLGVSISDMLNRLNETRKKLERSERVYRELFEKSRQLYEDEKVLREKYEDEIKKRTELSRALVHELKTPITPILAGLDLLQDEIHEEKLLQLLRSMDRSASNLNKRIDELLDLARAETNRLEIYVQTLNIKSLLQDIGRSMTSMAIKNGQTMVIDIPVQMPLISADGGRLRQVIENLLINALKFTPAGGVITLKATVQDDQIVVDVIDTGRGMTEEAQKGLFEPYYRNINDEERLSGLGLGLALSKNFIELHGGKIWFKSQYGKGSTFSFSLPLKTNTDGAADDNRGER